MRIVNHLLLQRQIANFHSCLKNPEIAIFMKTTLSLPIEKEYHWIDILFTKYPYEI